MKIEKFSKSSALYGLRFRHIVALLVCLGVILILAGYFSVNVGQKAALDSVKAQGRALTESLISSADMIIEADAEFTNIGINQIIDKITPYISDNKLPDKSKIDNIRSSINVDKICFVNDNSILSYSSLKSVPYDNDQISNWIDSLEISLDDVIIYDFLNIDITRYIRAYLPVNKTDGLFIITKWELGQHGNQKLSLYHLLNQVARESGVEFIMLQNYDGIVFASKKIASMTALSDDSFLTESLKTDTTRSRVISFQDREVLETTRTFKSNEFEGIFRVGLSLYGYRSIIEGMKRQVWLVVFALIIVGMLVFAVIVGFQNYDVVQSSLQKARVITQSLLDSIPGPVIAVSNDMKITDINAPARKIFDLRSESSIGIPYINLFPDDPFKFRQINKGSRTASFETILGTEKRKYFITATPLLDTFGKILGAIAIAQDITDSRKLEEVAESRRRLSELGALAASMAHEIRNPLNAIGITIQRMKSEIKPEENKEEYDKFIDGLRHEIKRLNSIIEKFLIVARSHTPVNTEFDITDLVDKAVELFRSQTESLNISLSYEVNVENKIIGDRDGILQVLINVIKNSIEAVEQDGNISITSAEDNNKLTLSIQDNGPGIKDVASALKPFHTTKKDGTGLGLSTASKIMADHGGELVIESKIGDGCRIDLILPFGRNDT